MHTAMTIVLAFVALPPVASSSGLVALDLRSNPRKFCWRAVTFQARVGWHPCMHAMSAKPDKFRCSYRSVARRCLVMWGFALKAPFLACAGLALKLVTYIVY